MKLDFFGFKPDICSRIRENNVEAFRYYLVLESGKFLLFKIMRM